MGPGGQSHIHKGTGLISDAFDEHALARLPGETAIGHIRRELPDWDCRDLANGLAGLARSLTDQPWLTRAVPPPTGPPSTVRHTGPATATNATEGRSR